MFPKPHPTPPHIKSGTHHKQTHTVHCTNQMKIRSGTHIKRSGPIIGFKGWKIYHVGTTPIKAQEHIYIYMHDTRVSDHEPPPELFVSIPKRHLLFSRSWSCACDIFLPSIFLCISLSLSLSLKLSSPFLSSFYLSLFSSFWSLLEVRVSTFNHFSFLSTPPFPFQNLPPTSPISEFNVGFVSLQQAKISLPDFKKVVCFV